MRRAALWWVLVCSPWAWAATPNVPPPPVPAAAAPKPMGCLIEPHRVADVGSQVVGVVERLHVERGARVAAGQPLVSLRSDIERANVQAARTRARVDADILAAEAGVDLAQQKVRRAESLLAQKFVSDQTVEQARSEAEVARQKLNQARSQQTIWVEESQVAAAQLALRTVRSPFAGVVVERYVNPGERVEEKPMVRVAVIDPLRVELMVPSVRYGTLALGDKLQIRPDLPGAEPVTATVDQVDRVLDAASNSYRVRLTLPNPGYRLPAGLRCKADAPAETAAQRADARPVAAPGKAPPAPRTAP